MAISDRVTICVQALHILRPEWKSSVERRKLTLERNSPYHLLVQVFGSFEAGEKCLTEHSGLTLVQLGLLPNTPDEMIPLLRQWYALLVPQQEARKSA